VPVVLLILCIFFVEGQATGARDCPAREIAPKGNFVETRFFSAPLERTREAVADAMQAVGVLLFENRGNIVRGERAIPRYRGGSASTSLLSRPAQASHALRPAELLTHHTWALSRGPALAGFPARALIEATKFNQQPPWVGPSPTGDLRRRGAPDIPTLHPQCQTGGTEYDVAVEDYFRTRCDPERSGKGH
jgi:hypothetical protein